MGVTPAPACLNCDTPLAGEYCFACGQRDLPPEPTLRELVSEAWDAFVSIDGKVFASLRLLLARPGALTTEYLGGHRVRFLPPLRLYLVCSVVYFLVVAALPERAPDRPTIGGSPPAVKTVPGHQDTNVWATERAARARADSVDRARSKDSARRAALASIGRPAQALGSDTSMISLADSVILERKLATKLGAAPGGMKRLFVRRIIRNAERISRDQDAFKRQMRDQVPRLMFVLMPAFGLLLALAYRSRRRRYPTHLIVSLHIHAFAFAALTIGALVAALPNSGWRSNALRLIALWMFAYVPLAFRRVYGGRLRAAVARAVALEVSYAFMALTALIAGALALVALY